MLLQKYFSINHVASFSYSCKTRMKNFYHTLFFIVFFPLLVGAQAYQPLRISETIKLDGKLDEVAWQQALVENDFMQEDPAAGAAPSEKAKARICGATNFFSVFAYLITSPKNSFASTWNATIPFILMKCFYD